MGELMNKADHDAGLLVDDLRECEKYSTGAENIVLRTLLPRAEELEQDIKKLKAAMEEV